MGNYAKYYRCALQVNPYSYSRYRGKEIQNELEYNNAILKNCKENNIIVVGLADHGCVDSSESLREKLQSRGIIVFPGFEITSAEKIHMVCLFPPEKTVSDLNRFLGVLGLDKVAVGNETSKMTCLSIAEKINELGGFWYAAHITGDNGILKLGKLNQIWKDKRLMAAQIPDSRENIDPKYANIIRNKDMEYKRDRPVALINACDIESPCDLEKENATTLIKMTDPSFENFLVAFKDPDSRIRLNSEFEKNYQSCINSLSVFGGYLDGLNVDFSDNLTTIIGGRGTGKSTIINLIRYALDLKIEDKEQLKNYNSMIDSNLGSTGKIELKVKSNTQFGKKFTIIRRYKQNSVVQDDQGNISSLIVSDILPTIEIYGQNEIVNIVNDPQKINKVVERLLLTDKDLYRELQEAYIHLVENGDKLDVIEKEKTMCNDNVSDLPAVKERLKFYKEAGLSDKMTIIKKLASEEGQFEAFVRKLPQDELNITEIGISKVDNNELKALAEAVEKYNKIIYSIRERYKLAIAELREAYEHQKKIWTDKKSIYDQEIKNSLKELDGIEDKSSIEIVTDYTELIKKVEAAEPIHTRILALNNEEAVLLDERKNLIEQYRICCDQLNQKTNKNIKVLNSKKLKGKLRLSIKFRQQKQKLIEFITKIEGIGEKSLSGIIQYDDFDVFTFVEDIFNGADRIKSKYSLTQNVAEKICTNLKAKDLRYIEQLQLTDLIEIELEVHNDYKKLNKLSKGQQCTAILNILLLDNKDPLIVDQPEDNLDNSFIAENLVDTIRENKIRRQYVFATHNANIPVFGDAELIITMEEVDRAGKVANGGMGSIDSAGVRNNVIQILEGGPEAFRMREEKYGIC